MRPAIVIEELGRHPEFLEKVLRWKVETWPEADPRSPEHDVARRVFDAARPEGLPLTLLALAAGQPVGFVCLIEHRMGPSEPLHPWVDALYVVPVERGHGIASRLLFEIETRARGASLLELLAYTDRLALYARAGWEAEPSPERSAPGPRVLRRRLR